MTDEMTDEQLLIAWHDRIEAAVRSQPEVSTPTGLIFKNRGFDKMSDLVNEIGKFCTAEKREIRETIFESDLVFKAEARYSLGR